MARRVFSILQASACYLHHSGGEVLTFHSASNASAFGYQSGAPPIQGLAIGAALPSALSIALNAPQRDTIFYSPHKALHFIHHTRH